MRGFGSDACGRGARICLENRGRAEFAEIVMRVAVCGIEAGGEGANAQANEGKRCRPAQDESRHFRERKTGKPAGDSIFLGRLSRELFKGAF